MKKFYTNPLGVIFHPKIDRQNNYKTIVYNFKKDKILKVDQFGYEILKMIDDNPSIMLDDLAKKMSITQASKLRNFLNQMVEENIVIEK